MGAVVYVSALNRGLEGHRSWLVQRLKKPFPAEVPFTPFGGGGLGGFTPAAFKKINKVFSFDYMGAAEFEFGEVPGALNRMKSSSSMYSPMVMDDVNSVKIYVVAPPAWYPEIEDRIMAWAAGKESSSARHGG